MEMPDAGYDSVMASIDCKNAESKEHSVLQKHLAIRVLVDGINEYIDRVIFPMIP